MQEAERNTTSEIEKNITRLHARILFVQAYRGIHEMDHFSHIANNILTRAVSFKDSYSRGRCIIRRYDGNFEQCN